jgi:hypothetical protein
VRSFRQAMISALTVCSQRHELKSDLLARLGWLR